MTVLDALKPLVAIADAYDDNGLDDEGRRFWGPNLEEENDRDPADIILYSGRGGKTLLTLKDAFEARKVFKAYHDDMK